jgi:hypothetical protein
MAVRALAGLVQFIFIKGKVTLTAVCRCNYQAIVGMLEALDKMMEVILHIFVRYLQMSGNANQVHGIVPE